MSLGTALQGPGRDAGSPEGVFTTCPINETPSSSRTAIPAPASSLGIVTLVIVLALGWYFLMGPGASTSTQSNDTNINVELPSVAPNPS